MRIFPDGVRKIFFVVRIMCLFTFLGKIFLGEFSPCLFFYSFSLPYPAQHLEVPLEIIHLLA